LQRRNLTGIKEGYEQWSLGGIRMWLRSLDVTAFRLA